MRVAFVHDWLTGMRGGEKVLEALFQLFPDAEIFTLMHFPGSVSSLIESRPIHASFLNRLPGIRRGYRYYLPLFPAAIERLDVRGFDLIVSISHCVAKGVRPRGTPHLCYCLTPMRYVWDLYEDYFGPGRAGPLVRAAAPVVARGLRRWDVATAERVDRFVGCSRHIQSRIRRLYDREAGVVYPPVDLAAFAPGAERDDFYLTVSALEPYKRVDLAIEAFNRMDRRLVVVGGGSELDRLRRLAGPNVSLVGRVSEPELASYYRRCRAFVFCAQEDFGIAPVEAQASGAPVIGYGVGGLTETVIPLDGEEPGATGVLYDRQEPDALIDALHRFEAASFDPGALVSSARRFGREQFLAGMREEIASLGVAP